MHHITNLNSIKFLALSKRSLKSKYILIKKKSLSFQHYLNYIIVVIKIKKNFPLMEQTQFDVLLISFWHKYVVIKDYYNSDNILFYIKNHQ